MSQIKTKIELTYRKGQEYQIVPIGAKLDIIEFLPRSGEMIAGFNGREFILEKDQFEEVKKVLAFRPPVRRKKRTKTG